MKREQLVALCRNTYRSSGDALAGERIYAQARKIQDNGVQPGTSTHRIQEVLLKSNVLCVIDKQFTVVRPQPTEPTEE